MAITLRHLCKYAKENYHMIQLAGEASMNRLVDWVHVLEDPEVASFLHGNELIFTTGIGQQNTDWFLGYIKDLVKQQVAGLVFNIGPYINEVPDQVVAYCNEVEFPLFTIPWETRIVDITNDFCHRIIRAEEAEVSLASAFRNAIFFPNNVSGYKTILEKKAFDLDADYTIASITFDVPDSEVFHQFTKNIRMHLSKILFNHSDRFNFFRQDNTIIVVMQNFSDEVVEKSIQRLNEICQFGDQSYKIFAGISSKSKGVESLPRSYKRSVEVLKMAIKKKTLYLSYNHIGIHQILIEVEDHSVLKHYYDETVGLLEDYDDKHDSDYFYILRTYLENNNSVEKVAKELYVHRNTINYKIKKIKEILGMEMNNEDVSKLLFAYKIKEML